MSRVDMKQVPVELDADRARAELEDQDLGKTVYHASAPIEVDPAEIDGQERQPPAYVDDIQAERAPGETTDVTERSKYGASDLSEPNAHGTPSLAMHSPLLPSPSETPGAPTGHALASLSEAELTQSTPSNSAMDLGRRKRLQRKRGFGSATHS